MIWWYMNSLIKMAEQLMISGGTGTLYLHLVQMICYVAIPWILSVHKMQQNWFIDNLKQREWQRWWQKRRRIFCKSPPLSPVLFLLLLPESHIDISNQCIITILIIWDLFARWIFFANTCYHWTGYWISLIIWQQLTLHTIKSNFHEGSI